MDSRRRLPPPSRTYLALKSLRFKRSNYKLSKFPLPRSYQIGRERSRTLTLRLRRGFIPGEWTLNVGTHNL